MIEKYNMRVRQAMSDEYVKCSKRKCQLSREYEEVLEKLETEKDTLSYRQYKGLECEADDLKRKYENEKIRLDVWDQAREICLNIADEML